jgi:hypothetical protein
LVFKRKDAMTKQGEPAGAKAQAWNNTWWALYNEQKKAAKARALTREKREKQKEP